MLLDKKFRAYSFRLSGSIAVSQLENISEKFNVATNLITGCIHWPHVRLQTVLQFIGRFPSQKARDISFDVIFVFILDKLLNKQLSYR